MRALSRVRKKPVGVGRIVMRRMQVVTFDDTLRTIRFWPNLWLVIFVVADIRLITMRIWTPPVLQVNCFADQPKYDCFRISGFSRDVFNDPEP